MKFAVKADVLEGAAAKLSAIVNKQSSIPILSHCLIDGGTGTVKASNLEASLELPLPVAKNGGERLCLHVGRLREISARLEGELSIETATNGAVLKAGKAKVRLNVLPAEQFPTVPTVESEPLVFPTEILNKLISRVLFAVCGDANRYVLAAAKMEITYQGKLRLVATDGSRLALAESAAPEGMKPQSLLIPGGALNIISNLDGDKVEIRQDARNISFQSGAEILVHRLVSGNFPSYEVIIPKESKATIKVVAGTLRRTLERALPVVDQKRRCVKLTTEPDGLTVFTESAEFGDFVEKIPATASGANISVGLDVDFVLDFLKIVEGEVVLNLTDEQSVTDWHSGEDYRYLVMPMRW